MLPTPYAAYLRVYEPIETFEPEDQSRWSKLKASNFTVRDEQIRSLNRSITNEPPNLKSDGAYLLDYADKRYVAPWSTSARCLRALQDFKYSVPPVVIKFFIPQTFEDSIDGINSIVEDKVSHVLTSTWSIPPRWFALFSPEDRLRGVNEDGLFTIARTSILNAKSRCSFTYQAVLSAFGEGAVEGEVAELLAWLEIFNTKSIVELDYGGLATYMNNQLIKNGEVGLEGDSSIEDVTTSIAGLASGDGSLAGMGYEKLVSRWRSVSALESAT
jgi:hypothetical protein